MNHVRECLLVAALATPWAPYQSPAWAQDSAQARHRTLNGIQLAYEEHGSGPALLLLHGFGQCRQTWKPLVPGLAAHYRVIIPDLRGHGGSTNPSGTFTHRQAALDMFALLDQLGIREFKAMGISVVAGREFTESDGANSAPVAIVNRAFADRYFPGMDAIGQRFTPSRAGGVSRQIVGVVADTRQFGLDEAAVPEFYIVHAQDPWPFLNVAVRASGDPSSVLPSIRQVIR